MEMIKLLKNRNRCLSEIITQSNRFLSSLRENDFSKTDLFKSIRNKLIKLLQLYDRKISLAKKDDYSNEIKSSLNLLINDQENLTRFILQLDKEICIQLENEKTKVQEDLITFDRQKQTIQKFKSSWVSENGAKLDGVL